MGSLVSLVSFVIRLKIDNGIVGGGFESIFTHQMHK